MKIILFDTLKAKKILTDAGVKEHEAEATVTMTYESVSEMYSTIFETFATKEQQEQSELRMENVALRIKVMFSSALLIFMSSAFAMLITLVRFFGLTV